MGAIATRVGEARRAHGAVPAPGLRESAPLSHAARSIHRAAETRDRVAGRERGSRVGRPKSLTPLSGKTNSVAEVKIDNQDSSGGHDLGDPDLAAHGKADDVAPTGGQTEKVSDCP